MFYKFNLEYATRPTWSASEKTITDHYPWYYLNTYVTNLSEGKTYVVDGQQRLTTLTLILIKLYHLCTGPRAQAGQLGAAEDRRLRRQRRERFWMGQGKRAEPLKALFEGAEYEPGPGRGHGGEHARQLRRDLRRVSTPNSARTSTRRTRSRSTSSTASSSSTSRWARRTYRWCSRSSTTEGSGSSPTRFSRGSCSARSRRAEVDQYNEIWEDLFAPLDAAERAGKKGSPDDFFSTYFKARFGGNRKESNARL